MNGLIVNTIYILKKKDAESSLEEISYATCSNKKKKI